MIWQKMINILNDLFRNRLHYDDISRLLASQSRLFCVCRANHDEHKRLRVSSDCSYKSWTNKVMDNLYFERQFKKKLSEHKSQWEIREINTLTPSRLP